MVTQVDRPPTLTSAAVKHLREAIFKGDFKPGEPLPEIQLSAILNISRGTVRETLRFLQGEGIVEIIAHRGAFVTELSIEKAREIYTLRAKLEPYAVRLVVESSGYSKQDIQELKALLKKLRDFDAEEKFYDAVNTDMDIHRTLCQGCKHKLLIHVLDSLQSLTRLFILNTKIFRSDKTRDYVSHLAILNAIKKSDPDSVEEIIKKHITEAGQSLIERMSLEVATE